MHTLSLPELQEKFREMQAASAETGTDFETPLVWTHFFLAETDDAMKSLAAALEALGLDPQVFDDEGESDGYLLFFDQTVRHTPESLFQVFAGMRALAEKTAGAAYDGVEVATIEEHAAMNAGCGCGAGCDCGEGCESCGEDAAGPCCGGGCQVRREGEPIENPELRAAMARLREPQIAGTPQALEAQQALAVALQRGLFLVPVLREALEKWNDAAAENGGTEGGNANAGEPETLPVMACTNEAGEEFLPVFTDEAALKAWFPEAGPAMVLTAPELWEFVLDQPECQGAVVNPEGESLPVSREMVQVLKEWIDGETGAA